MLASPTWHYVRLFSGIPRKKKKSFRSAAYGDLATLGSLCQEGESRHEFAIFICCGSISSLVRFRFLFIPFAAAFQFFKELFLTRCIDCLSEGERMTTFPFGWTMTTFTIVSYFIVCKKSMLTCLPSCTDLQWYLMPVHSKIYGDFRDDGTLVCTLDTFLLQGLRSGVEREVGSWRLLRGTLTCSTLDSSWLIAFFFSANNLHKFLIFQRQGLQIWGFHENHADVRQLLSCKMSYKIQLTTLNKMH